MRWIRTFDSYVRNRKSNKDGHSDEGGPPLQDRMMHTFILCSLQCSLLCLLPLLEGLVVFVLIFLIFLWSLQTKLQSIGRVMRSGVRIDRCEWIQSETDLERLQLSTLSRHPNVAAAADHNTDEKSREQFHTNVLPLW